MEIAIPIIVLLILGVGLYILIKNQIDSNSSKTQEQMEFKLNAFEIDDAVISSCVGPIPPVVKT